MKCLLAEEVVGDFTDVVIEPDPAVGADIVEDIEDAIKKSQHTPI